MLKPFCFLRFSSLLLVFPSPEYFWPLFTLLTFNFALSSFPLSSVLLTISPKSNKLSEDGG